MAKFVTGPFQNRRDKRVLGGYAYTQVPPGNNKANRPWTQVIPDYLNQTRHAGTAARGDLSRVTGVTQADLDNGLWFEWHWEAEIDPTQSDTANVALVKSQINDQEADAVTELAERLAYWGYAADSGT